MATWFEQRPGSEESLLVLYDTVGAAEEADLEEQVGDESDDPDRVTMSQAIGIIEHLLGGQPLPGSGQSDA